MLKDGRIRVGIVGANPNAGWAATAHVPALQASADFQITAVATTRDASAQEAAALWGASAAYSDFRALAADPNVDLVVVAVKAPFHRDIVMAALAAGKHVYCEWPVGCTLEQTQEMAAAETQSSARGFVGAQATFSPVFCHVKQLVADGYLGELQSVSIIASGMAWGPYIDIANAYSLDKSSGTTILTIPFGHAMAALNSIVGLPIEVSARIEYRRKQAIIAETGESRPMTAPDQLLVDALLPNGAPLSVHYRGGVSRGTNLLIELNGSEGDLKITGPAGHVQMFPVFLHGARGAEQAMTPITIPEFYTNGVSLAEGFARNVALSYARVAHDLRTGEQTSVSFGEAVKVRQVIDAVERAAQSGRRVSV